MSTSDALNCRWLFADAIRVMAGAWGSGDTVAVIFKFML